MTIGNPAKPKQNTEMFLHLPSLETTFFLLLFLSEIWTFFKSLLISLTFLSPFLFFFSFLLAGISSSSLKIVSSSFFDLQPTKRKWKPHNPEKQHRKHNTGAQQSSKTTESPRRKNRLTDESANVKHNLEAALHKLTSAWFWFWSVWSVVQQRRPPPRRRWTCKAKPQISDLCTINGEIQPRRLHSRAVVMIGSAALLRFPHGCRLSSVGAVFGWVNGTRSAWIGFTADTK